MPGSKFFETTGRSPEMIHHTRFRITTLFLLVWFSFGPVASEAFPDTVWVLQGDLLPLGDQVKASGQKLVSQPHGFTRISTESSYDSTIAHVAVHGFESEGYEWVGPLLRISEVYKYTFFYRYDWEDCPKEAARTLATRIVELMNDSPGVEKLVLFGHSYGGLVVTYCGSLLHLNIPVEVHTIASPLSGYSRLFTECGVEQDRDGRVIFPPWEDNITHSQWRTRHRLDNAFKRFREDPQESNLKDSNVFRLPGTMDGHRLGHNWSVTWVIDEYLGIPHSR